MATKNLISKKPIFHILKKRQTMTYLIAKHMLVENIVTTGCNGVSVAVINIDIVQRTQILQILSTQTR
jgi:hypothetical protein